MKDQCGKRGKVTGTTQAEKSTQIQSISFQWIAREKNPKTNPTKKQTKQNPNQKKLGESASKGKQGKDFMISYLKFV